MTNVIDLAERRELRRLQREVAEMQQQIDRSNFDGNEHLRGTVAKLQAIQLENRYAFLLAKLRPVLTELLELHALNFNEPKTELDSAINLANAAAMLLGDGTLIAGLRVRLEKRRAVQFSEYQRLRREFGPTLFEQQETETK